MEYSNYDKKMNTILFNQNCINGEEIANLKELKEIIQNLILKIGCEVLLFEWYDYLEKHIISRKQAFNFATWLFIYDIGKFNVKNPYPFLALLYKKMELNTNVNDDLENRFDTPYDRFMDISTGILVSSNLIDINEIDYFIPERNKKFLNELDKINIKER